MKLINFVIKVLIFVFLLFSVVLASESKYFLDGKKLFKKRDYDASKFLFEKDIVFNPKSEMSYLYLAKIFEAKKNEEDEEYNLNTVLLLNPKNEEALYMLMMLKINQSNFSEVKNLLKRFELVCSSSCNKQEKIKKKLEDLSVTDLN